MIRNIRLVMAAIVLLSLCVPTEVFCEPVGNLQVTLLPAGAISAGAKWRVVGETNWHASGDSVTYYIDNYPGGNCTIEFSLLSGWRTPQTGTLTVADGNVASTVATYHSASVTVADSVADFSLVQGNKGWYYGFRVYGLNTFNQFALTGTDTYGSLWYQGGLSRLWSMGGHPEPLVQPVRRWVSSIEDWRQTMQLISTSRPRGRYISNIITCNTTCKTQGSYLAIKCNKPKNRRTDHGAFDASGLFALCSRLLPRLRTSDAGRPSQLTATPPARILTADGIAARTQVVQACIASGHQHIQPERGPNS